MTSLKKTATFIFYSLLILFAYSLFSSAIGGLHANSKQLFTEFPICLLLNGLIYLSLKPSRYRVLIAYTPTILFYLAIDIYYLVFGEVFRFVSLKEAPELFILLNGFQLFLMSITGLLVTYVFVQQVEKQKSYFFAAAVLFLIALALVVNYSPTTYIQTFEKASREIVSTKADRNIKYNGKLSTLFYEEAKRQKIMKRLAFVDENPAIQLGKKRAKFLKQRLKRPIFIYQLESFIDPTELKALNLGESFNNEFFQEIIAYKGHTQSPTFGGHTPQAEFEVLCAAPALAKFSDIEFNRFTGNKSDCIASWVAMAGFPTTVNFAYSPAYFNALKAYESVGFQEIRFPKEYSTVQKHPLHQELCGNEKIMQDKALFEQSLAYYLNQKERISLTYSMGMYGHWPFVIDRSCHADYLKVDRQYSNASLERAINQYRYRTASIANFIPQLFAAVPDALVLLISDHLPPITDQKNAYANLQYHNEKNKHPKTNVFYIFDSGRALDMSEIKDMHHYQAADMLFDIATSGDWCREFDCAIGKQPDDPSLYQRYLTVTKLASQ